MIARFTAFIVVTSVCFFVSSPVFAGEEAREAIGEDKSFYAGFGTGSFRLKKLSTRPENRILSLPGVVGVIDVKKDGDAKKIFLGYKPYESVSFEAIYLKATDFHVRLLASNSLVNFSSEKDGEVSALGLSVKKDWALSSRFSVYGAFGVYRYQLYVKMDAADGFQTITEEGKEYGNTISLTAGVAYRLGRRWTVSTEAERNGAKVNYVTLTRNF